MDIQDAAERGRLVEVTYCVLWGKNKGLGRTFLAVGNNHRGVLNPEEIEMVKQRFAPNKEPKWYLDTRCTSWLRFRTDQ